MGVDVNDHLSTSAVTVGAGSAIDAGTGFNVPAKHPNPIIAAGGIPDSGNLPSEAIREAFSTVLNDTPGDSLKYGGVKGFEDLRDLVAQRQNRLEGLNLDADNIIIHNGGSGCLDNICKAFLDPGDVVIIEAPTYSGTTRCLKGYLADLVEVDIDEDGLIIEQIREAIDTAEAADKRVKMVYCTPDFQNPTAATLPETRRRELIELCGKHKVLIVEDCTYSELYYYDNPPPPSMFALSGGEGVLKLGTFSKVIATGLRAGWVQGRKDYIEAMGRVRFDMGTSPILNHMLANFIGSGQLEPHIEKMKRIYGKKIDTLVNSLNENCAPYVKFSKPGGGFFFWFECIGVDSQSLVDAAAEEGLVISTSSNYYLDKENSSDKSHVRLAFSNASLDDLNEIGVRLGNAFNKLMA